MVSAAPYSKSTRATKHAAFSRFFKIKHSLLNITLLQHLIIPCSRTRNSNLSKRIQIYGRVNIYAYSFYPRVTRARNLLSHKLESILSMPTLRYFDKLLLSCTLSSISSDYYSLDTDKDYFTVTHLLVTPHSGQRTS